MRMRIMGVAFSKTLGRCKARNDDEISRMDSGKSLLFKLSSIESVLFRRHERAAELGDMFGEGFERGIGITFLSEKRCFASIDDVRGKIRFKYGNAWVSLGSETVENGINPTDAHFFCCACCEQTCGTMLRVIGESLDGFEANKLSLIHI